tara:strand:+ start:466 stop:663 length:198 start_codon:yes stop_codon:yes gene_type:complete
MGFYSQVDLVLRTQISDKDKMNLLEGVILNRNPQLEYGVVQTLVKQIMEEEDKRKKPIEELDYND